MVLTSNQHSRSKNGVGTGPTAENPYLDDPSFTRKEQCPLSEVGTSAVMPEDGPRRDATPTSYLRKRGHPASYSRHMTESLRGTTFQRLDMAVELSVVNRCRCYPLRKWGSGVCSWGLVQCTRFSRPNDHNTMMTLTMRTMPALGVPSRLLAFQDGTSVCQMFFTLCGLQNCSLTRFAKVSTKIRGQQYFSDPRSASVFVSLGG